jgi:hypothetical protein
LCHRVGRLAVGSSLELNTESGSVQAAGLIPKHYNRYVSQVVPIVFIGKAEVELLPVEAVARMMGRYLELDTGFCKRDIGRCVLMDIVGNIGLYGQITAGGNGLTYLEDGHA